MLAVERKVSPGDVDRRGDLLEQALRDDRAASAGSPTDVEEHGELVTAEPRDRVARADHVLQPLAEDREHLVADAVPVAGR